MNNIRVCVITDNEFIYKNFCKLISKHNLKNCFFDFFTSKEKEIKNIKNECFLPCIRLKDLDFSSFCNYDLVISAHCKQLFPNYLVDNIRCINIHPGLNPYNRGWFPQAFSIINGYPIGATIHEIDSQLDHGKIIVQEEVRIEKYDTSFDVYSKVQNKEIELLDKYFEKIIFGNYNAVSSTEEGNLNLKRDFDDLCHLDLNKEQSISKTLDLLRALTFNGYNNAYFFDENGNKIYVSINLIRDDK